jgi:hypothetical protein
MTHPALPLRETQIEHAGFVLGRAFHDDPLMTFVFPDDDQRFRELPWFMSVAVRIGMRGGRVHTDDRVAGCAVWLPPGAPTSMMPPRPPLASETRSAVGERMSSADSA